MKLASYWLDTSEPFRSATPGPVQGTCDVAVIGGGLTGCSAALAMAKKGAHVVLLEAGTIGHAASSRNGGMCNNGFAQDYGLLSCRPLWKGFRLARHPGPSRAPLVPAAGRGLLPAQGQAGLTGLTACRRSCRRH